MKLPPKALLFISVPPPYGGGEIAGQYLSEALKDKYPVVEWRQEKKSRLTQGRLRFGNFVGSVRRVVVFWKALLRHRPKVVFVGIGVTLPSYLRDVIMISVTRPFKITIIGDLHAAAFRFLGRTTLVDAFFRRTVVFFSAIRVLGRRIGEGLVESGFRGRLYVIDNGVNAEAGTAKIEGYIAGSRLRILYLGSIEESKGIFRCLDVLSILKAENVPFLFTIVGEWRHSEVKRKFYQIVSEQFKQQEVVVKGRLLGQEKWNVITKQNVLLHLTDWDAQPLTILEGMSIGIPTISTFVGAIPETISDRQDGFLVKNVIIESARILMDLYSGKIDWKMLSEMCIETHKERLTSERCSQKVENMLQAEIALTRRS